MTIGIMTAMVEEASCFVDLADVQLRRIADAYTTSIEVERHDAVLCLTGLGKVQAATAATLLIDKFKVNSLFNCGTCAWIGREKRPETAIADKVIQHDYGTSQPDGRTIMDQPGEMPDPSKPANAAKQLDPYLKNWVKEALGPNLNPWRWATFASGDLFVNDGTTAARLLAAGAQAVDMELAAIAQVGDAFGIPWFGIKSPADGGDHEEFRLALRAAAGKAARITRRLVAGWRE